MSRKRSTAAAEPMLTYITAEQVLVGIVGDWSVGALGNDACLDARCVLLGDYSRHRAWTQDVALFLQQ